MPHVYVTDDSLVHVVDGLYEFSIDPSRGLPPVCNGWELTHYYWVGGLARFSPEALEAEVTRVLPRGSTSALERLHVYWSERAPTCFQCASRWLRRM